MNKQSINIFEVTRPAITHMPDETIKKSCIKEHYAKKTNVSRQTKINRRISEEEYRTEGHNCF